MRKLLKDKFFWVWMICAGGVAYTGYKALTSIGESKAYEKIADDMDSGSTVIMDTSDGRHIFARKVDMYSDQRRN